MGQTDDNQGMVRDIPLFRTTSIIHIIRKLDIYAEYYRANYKTTEIELHFKRDTLVAEAAAAAAATSGL